MLDKFDFCAGFNKVMPYAGIPSWPRLDERIPLVQWAEEWSRHLQVLNTENIREERANLLHEGGRC